MLHIRPFERRPKSYWAASEYAIMNPQIFSKLRIDQSIFRKEASIGLFFSKTRVVIGALRVRWVCARAFRIIVVLLTARPNNCDDKYV
jgi:hypothetical protein